MARRTWIESMIVVFRTNSSSVAQSYERYLNLATKCMEEVQRMTSPSVSTSLKFNQGQCEYLAKKLKMTVQSMGPDTMRSYPAERIAECHEIFKLLFRLATQVKGLIKSCCQKQWIQAAIVLTDVSERVLSLAYYLKLCCILLRRSLIRSRSWLTVSDLAGVSEDEVAAIRGAALVDKMAMLSKVEALVEARSLNNLELQMAASLLFRLKQPLPESSRLSVWEVDYSSLEPMETLGKGSAGTVHKTIWLGAHVAEKTFCGTHHPSFETEVSVLAGLSHPNIVPLLGYAMDRRKCSILLELMDGDLYFHMQQRLRRNRGSDTPFCNLEAVDIMLQVAEGMHYLHQNKVVHRDLKSHNILVKKAKGIDVEYVCTAKVADFGLSKTKEASSTFSSQTQNTGTTRWMAPELMNCPGERSQAGSSNYGEDSLKYPFKSDVYSFGMVCYEILTGEVPFSSISDPKEVKKEVLDGRRPKLPDECPYMFITSQVVSLLKRKTYSIPFHFLTRSLKLKLEMSTSEVEVV